MSFLGILLDVAVTISVPRWVLDSIASVVCADLRACRFNNWRVETRLFFVAKCITLVS